MKQTTFFLSLIIVTASMLGYAESLPAKRTTGVLAAPLLKTAPAIDGVLKPQEWQQAQPLHEFVFNKGLAYATEGWVARDDHYFYLAARCHDDTPDKLVTTFEGRALWKNDCIELCIVPEKKVNFAAKFTLSCDGKHIASSWIADEWGEATEGPAVPIQYATGREPKAWTMEVAIPIAAFEHAIKPDSVWALGFNREKHTEPEELSAYQGGFNTPAKYADLVFDNRTILADGLGLYNIGNTPENVTVSIITTTATRNVKLTLPPFERQSIPWQKQLATMEPDVSFQLQTADSKGRVLLTEAFTLLAAAPAAIDMSKIPPANFRKTVLDDPAFFPIAVWAQPAGAAAGYKEMGVNVYVAGIDAYPNPKGAKFLDAMQAAGMVTFIPFTPAHVEEKLYEHPAMVGWMHGDEPDNSNPQTGQVNHSPEALIENLAKIRTTDPTHPIYLNLGQGVAEETFVGRAATLEQYRNYPKACDIICFDVYPCNSVQPNGPDRLHLVAKGIDRLRQWAGPNRPVWAWIEVNRFGRPNEPGRAPTPEEVNTQIWMALVHGARGYGFFCHSWNGPWIEENLGVKKPSMVTAISKPMREALKVINAEVKELAPVLNSLTIENGATAKVAPGGRVDTLVKKAEGKTYVFAVNMVRRPVKAEIRIAGAGNGQAEVLFENRTVPVKDGILTDAFEPYAVHRYRLP